MQKVAIRPTIEPSGGRDTNCSTITPKQFSHCCESSRPHNSLLNLDIWQRDWEAPGNLTLKISGIWLQNFHRTGETQALGRHKQNPVCTRTQEKGAVTPQETSIEIEGNKSKICVEPQKTLNNQSNPEKEQSWRCHTFWFQTILQSYSKHHQQQKNHQQPKNKQTLSEGGQKVKGKQIFSLKYETVVNLTVYPWVSCSVAQRLNFLLCKMKVLTTSRASNENLYV